ncbi:MAG: dTMP kinase [Trueperaceae bacterium]
MSKKNPLYKGLFVCLEGIDGAGKTTLAKQLVIQLQSQNIDAVLVEKNSSTFDNPFVTRHSSILSPLIWDTTPEAPLYLLGDNHWLHLIAAWLFLVDHARLQPLLVKHSVVISDGWYFKYLARFTLKANFDQSLVLHTFQQLTSPDQVIFVHLPPEVAANRKAIFSTAESGGMDNFSANPRDGFIAYQTKVQALLEEWSQAFGWNKIDGQTTESQLVEKVICALKQAICSPIT